VFRSLVAYRARLASERGYRYLQVDASAASRPILVRLGFTELATTTPFRHPGHLSGPQPVAPGVVRRGTKGYDEGMAHPGEPATDVSVRQFVADSGAVTRGLRQGRTYTLTLNGEPLAKMIPIRRRRAVPKEEVLAIFATAPAIDAEELRADLDEAVSQELRDPYEGTGL
jgi:antitoxin (DNA-binding transcriptional repressor) of toxin-antitoxin stability system